MICDNQQSISCQYSLSATIFQWANKYLSNHSNMLSLLKWKSAILVENPFVSSVNLLDWEKMNDNDV